MLYETKTLSHITDFQLIESLLVYVFIYVSGLLCWQPISWNLYRNEFGISISRKISVVICNNLITLIYRTKIIYMGSTVIVLEMSTFLVKSLMSFLLFIQLSGIIFRWSNVVVLAFIFAIWCNWLLVVEDPVRYFEKYWLCKQY